MMKNLIAILALSCFSTVLTLSHARDNTAQGLAQNAGLSNSELQQVRERLPCLKPGMTMKEVFELLGIDLRERAYAVWGSGPTDDYRMVYQLAPASNEHGYNLIIVHDQERKFKRADIACWREQNKCAEDNERAKNGSQECPNESNQ
jgi:hypothetical protein